MINYKYLAVSTTLFLTEYYIAEYVHDEIVRPYIGDLLVAILIYCLVKSVVNTPVVKTAICVLFYCYAVEVSQYFHLIVHLGLQNSKAAHMLLGSYFTWIDMLCYTIGIGIVLVIEAIRPNHKEQTA